MEQKSTPKGVGRPRVKEMPEPIPDTPENVARAIMSSIQLPNQPEQEKPRDPSRSTSEEISGQ